MSDERPRQNSLSGLAAELINYCSKGDLEGVLDLLNTSPELVNHRTEDGTPLKAAVCSGQLDIVRLLLAQGAKLGDGDEVCTSRLED